MNKLENLSGKINILRRYISIKIMRVKVTMLTTAIIISDAQKKLKNRNFYRMVVIVQH